MFREQSSAFLVSIPAMDNTEDIKSTIENKASEVVGEVKEVAGNVAEKAGGFLDSLKEKAQDTFAAAVDETEELTGKDLNNDGSVGNSPESAS